MRATIDLNCDLGEGCGKDAELMKYISSANIACGYHAGDADTMRRTVELAIENGVAIGAHPGYPDRENFGRTELHLPPNEVRKIVTEQIEALHRIATSCGGKLRHVKAHGALYNQAAKDAELANAIASAVKDFDDSQVLFCLAGSEMLSIAEAMGLMTASEVFADRTYRADGSLTPRSQPNALIKEEATALEQVLQIVQQQTVTATGGQVIPIRAETICIHGDGENAVAFAKAIRKKLEDNSIEILSK